MDSSEETEKYKPAINVHRVPVIPVFLQISGIFQSNIVWSKNKIDQIYVHVSHFIQNQCICFNFYKVCDVFFHQ